MSPNLPAEAGGGVIRSIARCRGVPGEGGEVVGEGKVACGVERMMNLVTLAERRVTANEISGLESQVWGAPAESWMF